MQNLISITTKQASKISVMDFSFRVSKRQKRRLRICFLVPTVICVGLFQSDLLVLNYQSYVPACQRSIGAYILVCAFPGDSDVLAGGYSFLNIVESVFDEESKRQKKYIQNG